MKITVVGIGYVGLSIGMSLCNHHEVLFIDIDKNKVNLLRNKKSPFFDDDVSKMLKSNLKFDITCDKYDAYSNADIVIIATPTNFDNNKNSFDCTSVESVIYDVKTINPNAWIVIKSTVGVGFTLSVRQKYNFDNIIVSPEFLREGKALYDCLNPSRIVIGIPQKNKKYIDFANEFSKILIKSCLKKDIPIFIVGSSEAEAIKLFANTYLALRVSYFNELDTFASLKGLDTLNIIDGVCSDPRIGDFYNNPSFGYGGYCLPKDANELKADFKDIPQNLISAITESNSTRKQFIFNEIKKKIDSLKIKKENTVIGIYRLVMKTNSDNFRNSSVIDVIKLLENDGYKILIYEPKIKEGKFLSYDVLNDFNKFQELSSIIICNRWVDDLLNVKEKVYSRDIFKRD